MKIFVWDIDASNRYELLSSLANKLHNMSFVKETYLNALIDREENYPTGLVVRNDFNVAIPHADVEHVNEEALVVVKTNRKVAFRKMDEPNIEIPVDVVFLLVIKEPKGYVKFLAALTELFTKEEFVETILHGSDQEIEKYLESHLLSYRF